MLVTPKEAREKVGLLDIVEAPSNGRTIMIPTNQSRILSAYKYTEDMNAKLKPRMSSRIRGQLATNKPSIVRVILKAKAAFLGVQRILWVAEWVGCIRDLEFNKEVHF